MIRKKGDFNYLEELTKEFMLKLFANKRKFPNNGL